MHAGACACPKGTFRYSYFPKVIVKVVLGILASLGVCDSIQLRDQRLKNILHY